MEARSADIGSGQDAAGILVCGRVRRSLELPGELAEIADEEGWSFRELKDLLAYRDMVVARRTQPGTAHDPDRALTREQWRELHDWLSKSPIR